MSSLSRARVAVIGGGALGMATAATLARSGATALVFDPAQAASASAVAAGMISPAFEAVLEDAAVERAELYRRAAFRWQAFNAEYGLGLIGDGADWRGPPEPFGSKLAALGFEFRKERGVLHAPGEARLNARFALERLNDEVKRAGGAVLAQRVRAVEERDGRPLVRAERADFAVDFVVLAAGWSVVSLPVVGVTGLADVVSPVRGQLQLLQGRGLAAIPRIVRTPDVYLTPVAGRLVVGATMEPGRSDTRADPVAAERLLAAAIEAEPALADAEVAGSAVGIRGAAPDGLPIAGKTSNAAVFAALAPRRGGWLLAPLVAETVVAAMAGGPAAVASEAFRPDRFGPV